MHDKPEKAMPLLGLKAALIPVLTGFLGTMLVMSIWYATLNPAPALRDFTPSTCTAPPHSCWDGWQKETFPTCTYFGSNTLVRGEMVKAGTKLCYKTVYVNVEPRLLYIVGWFMFWALLTSRAIERIAQLVLFERRFRLIFVVGVVLNFWSVFYSCTVLIHYLNDVNFRFWASQMYFSLSELFVFGTAVYLMDDRVTLPPSVIYAAMGTAMYHVFQLLLDENLLVIGKPGRLVIRNLALFSSDFLFSIAFRAHLPNSRRKWLYIGSIMVANLLTFTFIFADDASFGVAK